MHRTKTICQSGCMQQNDYLPLRQRNRPIPKPHFQPILSPGDSDRIRPRFALKNGRKRGVRYPRFVCDLSQAHAAGGVCKCLDVTADGFEDGIFECSVGPLVADFAGFGPLVSSHSSRLLQGDDNKADLRSVRCYSVRNYEQITWGTRMQNYQPTNIAPRPMEQNSPTRPRSHHRPHHQNRTPQRNQRHQPHHPIHPLGNKYRWLPSGQINPVSPRQY